MFQETPDIFQLTPRVGLFKTVDKVSVKSHLNHDTNNTDNLCLALRDAPLTMVIFCSSCHEPDPKTKTRGAIFLNIVSTCAVFAYFAHPP